MAEEENEVGFFLVGNKNKGQTNDFKIPFSSNIVSHNPSNNNNNNSSDIMSYGKFYNNTLRDPGKEGRNASRLIFLRQFNNWIKAVQINKYVNCLGRESLSVFDICCGRGGDLKKFFFNHVKLYVGADLSGESLQNAMSRIKRIETETLDKKLGTKCVLIKEDVSDPNNKLQDKINVAFRFDLVSCQFALHYHFESEIRLRTFLKNVVSRLCDGGYFICTIVDDNVLVKRLREHRESHNNDDLTFGNDFYSIRFKQKNFNKKNGPFGIQYGFYLEDSIGKTNTETGITYVGEYLIVFKEFEKICREYNLHLVEKKNFTDFYQENKTKFHRMFNSMVTDLNPTNKEAQWEIAHLYQAVTFRKGNVSYNVEEGKSKYIPYLKTVGKIDDLDNLEPEYVKDEFE